MVLNTPTMDIIKPKTLKDLVLLKHNGLLLAGSHAYTVEMVNAGCPSIYFFRVYEPFSLKVHWHSPRIRMEETISDIEVQCVSDIDFLLTFEKPFDLQFFSFLTEKDLISWISQHELRRLRICK